MPRPRNPIPTYRLHKQSAQAVVTLRLPDGTRKDVLLGPYNSPESKAEYRRVLAEWQATGGRVVAPSGLSSCCASAAPDPRRADSRSYRTRSWRACWSTMTTASGGTSTTR
jgi:hypothetical protein